MILEDVINALERHVKGESCINCPYTNCGANCMNNLKADALEHLKDYKHCIEIATAKAKQKISTLEFENTQMGQTQRIIQLQNMMLRY